MARNSIMKRSTKSTKKTVVRSTKKIVKNYVVVSSKSYGNALKGTKIYFEGAKPKTLRKDGTISFGKHILEALNRKFDSNFRWIITKNIDSITIERKIPRIRTSMATLTKMGRQEWDRKRDIKNDIVSNFFSIIYPQHFQYNQTPTYIPGSLSKLLDKNIIPRLSSEDRDSMNEFLPEFISAESLNTVNLLKATAQIKTLKELATDLSTALSSTYSEHHWQTYIKKNILIIQQGYISAIDKMNVAIGDTKYPDFMLVTHDNYLDILEIKKPNTKLIKLDKDRNNYYWDTEITKAVIQVENYIEYVQHHADIVRNYIRDRLKIDLKVVRPRGIILAGNTSAFTDIKERDDYRLLSLSTKNITFLTYDELLNRLNNYIKVLEEFSVKDTK